MKTTKNRRIVAKAAAICAAVLILAAACSSSDDGDNGVSDSVVPVTASVSVVTTLTEDTATTVASTTTTSVVETVSVVVPFSGDNGDGKVTISGNVDLPIMRWFNSLQSDHVLSLGDVDVFDVESVVEGVIGYWYGNGSVDGEILPVVVSSEGSVVFDSLDVRYEVESVELPAAPGTEPVVPVTTTSVLAEVPDITTTTTTSPTTTTTAVVPSTTTTSLVPTTTTTSSVPEVLDISEVRVAVLNGSGVSGAAGRLTARLEEAGYLMLTPVNAPRRYASSAVYYVGESLADDALSVAVAIGETTTPPVLRLPDEISYENAHVVVLIGADDVADGLRPPRAASSQSGLRPSPRSDVALPLSDDIPRDRFVPGLASIQIFSEVNDNSEIEEVRGGLNALSRWMNLAGYYSAPGARSNALPLEDYMDYEYLRTQIYPNIERVLEYFGFTPQNTCGAPAGYSFTDLLQPTREFNTEIQSYSGNAIFTTDRLLELHGGERINTETNLDYYIGEAVQTAYDSLRIPELVSETEAMQLVLCVALVSPAGEIPEAANSLWYANLTPGIRQQESLLSQGTYHVKEISKNGNIAYLIVCHPTLGERHILLHWREAGYRAEVVTSNLIKQVSGCQASYEVETYIYEDTNGAEDTLRYSFGEQVFAASDLSSFPRR